MDCPHARRCPLFEQFALSSVLKIWQINYCQDGYEKCVRYQMNVKGRFVRPTILPNGEDLQDKAPK